MPASLAGQLVVAISSRALFDFEEENEVFEASDDRAYMALQLDRLDAAAKPGVAFSLVNKLLAFNVGVIVPWLEQTFGFQIMPGDVYYVTAIPSEVHLSDVIAIPAMALVVAMLATIYPSRKAAAVSPAQALRYE